MSTDFRHSSSERHRKRSRSLSCALGFTSFRSSRTGSVWGRANLTPWTPSTTKSSLTMERGEGEALESAWIQRLKPASAAFEPNRKASSKLLGESCINETRSTGQALAESRKDEAEAYRRMSGEFACMPTNDTFTRFCEKVHSIEKSVSITKPREKLMLAANKGPCEYTANKKFKPRSQESAALNNGSKDLERHSEVIWRQREYSHGGRASSLQVNQKSLGLSPNVHASPWIRQTEGHTRIVVPKAFKGLVPLPGAAKEKLVFVSSKLNAKPVDARLGTPDTGTSSQTIAGFRPFCPSFRKPPLPPPSVFPSEVVCGKKSMLCRLDDSDVEASPNKANSEKAAWELSKRSSYIWDGGKETCAKARRNVACKKGTSKGIAEESRLSTLASKKSELSFLEQLEKPQSGHARHQTFASISSHDYTGENAWPYGSFSSQFEKRLFKDSNPRLIENVPTELALLDRGQQPKSSFLELPDFGSTRDISFNSFPCNPSVNRLFDVKYGRNVDQLAPSDTEEDGAHVSLFQGTESSDNHFISKSSPASAVQMLGSAQDGHEFANSPLPVSLPCELQRLSTWKYGGQSPSLTEWGSLSEGAQVSKPNADAFLNQRLCAFEERSQTRQHKEVWLDLNRSVQNIEDHTPSERWFLQNMEAEWSPAVQERREENDFQCALETEQSKHVLPAIMDVKEGHGLFPSSSKCSRPDGYGYTHICSTIEGDRGKVKNCELQSHYSWLNRWISPSSRSNHLGLPEPLIKPTENDMRERFLNSKQIPSGGSFKEEQKNPFQDKATRSSVLQETTPFWNTHYRPSLSSHRRIQFFASCAPFSREYNIPSAAALALAGTVAKQDHSPSARCKGLLEAFPSVEMQQFSRHRESLEDCQGPQTRYVVQFAEQHNSNS